MAAKFLHNKINWLKSNRRQVLTLAVVGLVIVQLVVFRDRAPLFMKVDNQSIGGWSLDDATKRLDEVNNSNKVELFMESTDESFDEIEPAEIGVQASNQNRVESLRSPVWLRAIPTSVFWAHLTASEAEPDYSVDGEKTAKFINENFGKECRVEPENASLEVKDESLEVVPSRNGGVCKTEELHEFLSSVKIAGDQNIKVEIPVKPIEPKVKDDQASKLKDQILSRLESGAKIKTGNEDVNIDKKSIIAWLEFDSSGDDIKIIISPKKSQKFLSEKISPKVAVKPGVTKVVTRDFVEVSRVDGVKGVALDFAKTRVSLEDYLAGKNSQAEAASREIEPKIEYSRSYSNTDKGLSSLLQNYAKDRSGKISVSVVELSGQRRRASYGGDRQITAASTYKMLLAMSILKRVESGELSWNDKIVGGRNLNKCFSDMITVSDNDCPLALVKRIGFSNVQADMRALGLSGTNFLDTKSFKTSTNDLAKFAAMLQSRQLPISRGSHDRLISAMRNNVYRQGIPAGTSGSVANKVGFLNEFLHDAGIVYSPSGTYALAIMTEKSSWADIAKLTSEIEKLRKK